LNDSTFLENQKKQANKPLALFLVAFSVGIVIDFYSPLGIPEWSIAAVIGVVFWGLASRFWRDIPVSSLSFPLLLATVSIGGAWHHLNWNCFGESEIGLLASDVPTPISLQAIVQKQPEQIPAPPLEVMDRLETGDRTRIELAIISVRNDRAKLPVKGKIIATVNGVVDDLRAGDAIQVFGQLSLPAPARSGGDFDLRKFYRSKRINAVVFVNHPKAIKRLPAQDQNFPITRSFDQTREYFYGIFEAKLTTPNARLLSAILLGNRTLIARNQIDRFLTTGTMHLLAISGLHIGILCSIPLLLIRFGLFGERPILIGLIGFVIFYCVLTGMRPPVVRATILIALFCAAKLCHKKPLSVNSLSLAGIVVTVMNPTAIFQTGAQLSFLAVAILIFVNERFLSKPKPTDSLERFLFRKRSFQKRLGDTIYFTVKTFLISSISIWLMTLPLVVENFHVVSPIGIIANLLLMIPVWLTLQFGFALMIFGQVPFLGDAFARINNFLLTNIQSQVDLYHSVPGGHWWSYGLGTFWLSLFYIAFISVLLFGRIPLPTRWLITLAMLWLALAISIPEIRNATKQKELVVTFIDVSHGTSVLIEYPNGRAILYDAGSLNSSKMATDRISAVLWQKKIHDLDAVILSHADLDHYNSMLKLVHRFNIRQLLVSPFMFQEIENEPLRQLQKLSERDHLPIQEITTQSLLKCDPECLTIVLHPTPDFVSESDNAKSIVLLLEFGRSRVLLTGDLELEGQQKLLGLTPIDCDVIMAPHHGSLSSNHFSVAEWSSPEHVVISCAKEKVRDAVINDYEAFDASVYKTSDNGAIEFRSDGNNISVDVFIK
jgi:competence protein ComEC